MSSRVELLPLRAETYEPHWLHGNDQAWTETNCYVDVWIEVLHGLGLDPLAASAFTLSADFEGDQWTFIKFPLEDLRQLYGIDVAEAVVWRPVVEHVEEHLAAGRLMTIEADSWFLPDTRGTSYQAEHVKTTIVPQMLDRVEGRLGYFHAAGYYELEGDDFEGVFGPVVLPPYVELVKLDHMKSAGGADGGGDVVSDDLQQCSFELARSHLARRPQTSPVDRMAVRLESDLPWLIEQGIEAFHNYAFVTVRQCGACTALAAAYVDWLAAAHDLDLGEAAERLRSVSTTAKSLQFALARATRGRSSDTAGPLKQMASDYDRAMAQLADRCRA